MCFSSVRERNSISEKRVGSVKRCLAEIGADAMLIFDTANIEWITAFQNVFDDERAHAAFVSCKDENAFVHTDSRYITAMQRESEGSVFRVDSEAVSFSQWAHSMWECSDGVQPHGDEGKLAIEDSMSLSQYRALERSFGGSDAFLETSGLILGLRSVKDPLEIELMRKAQAITDAAFSHIVEYMRPGMTEREVQMELDRYMLENGASGLAFQTIVASGERGASPHAIVTDEKLEAGQCVVMDFGARFADYCSDMTRTVFLGKPDGEMLAAWECLVEANEDVQAMLKPSVTGKQAHELALKILEDGGFGGRMGHGLGHGVGLEIHEEPVLSPRNDKPLEVGNVVTVEPGIYIPGRFGMRLEDFGVVTDCGFDVLTRSTHDMVVI